MESELSAEILYTCIIIYNILILKIIYILKLNCDIFIMNLNVYLIYFSKLSAFRKFIKFDNKYFCMIKLAISKSYFPFHPDYKDFFLSFIFEKYITIISLVH